MACNCFHIKGLSHHFKIGPSRCRKTLLNEKNVFSPASTHDTERWVPLIRTCCGVNLLVCCLAEGVVSGDYTCIGIVLKTNRLSLSLSRVCPIPNGIEKKKMSPTISPVDTWCLAAGGGEQGQGESLGEMRIGKEDLQACTLSKLLKVYTSPR